MIKKCQTGCDDAWWFGVGYVCAAILTDSCEANTYWQSQSTP
ncbi:hypothetical protein [Fluoribacter gormanii]|nr:hypothetical protein [Fluoribacter gormanii]